MSESSAKLLPLIHERLFQILCDIDDYCQENKINYYLSGGTCLGAARHHGFIPWDDDADIMMPRKEYERFIEGFRLAYKDRYRVLSLQTDPEWPVPRGKVEDLRVSVQSENASISMAGFAVDVFPIDGLPDQEWKQLVQDFEVKVLLAFRNAALRQNFYPGERYRLLKAILGIMVKVFRIDPRRIAERIERKSKRYDFDQAKCVAGRVTTHYGVKREKLDKRDVESTVYLDFEGRKLPVFNGYKKYLTNLYGKDYMQIPKDRKILGYTHLGNTKITVLADEGGTSCEEDDGCLKFGNTEKN